MKPIQLLVVTPYASDANSFWRCIGPMSYFSKTISDLTENRPVQMTVLDETKPFMWNHMMPFDVLFMHRPCRENDLILMRLAYNLNIPLWVDFDDWLFAIPGWNPNAGAYMNSTTQLNMASALALADVVSVSTSELYRLYSQVNANVVIVPNSYRSDLFNYRNSEQPRQNDVMWRGSNTHDGDLLSVKQGLQNLSHKILFLGQPSWILLSGMKQNAYEIKNAADVIVYFKFICDLAPKVLVFPLVDCVFNRAKSNIAYIEAIHAGAICVAPDLPEWRHPGVITYKPHDSDSFLEAVDYSMELSEPKHLAEVQAGFEHMVDNFDITQTNHIRHQIMSHLLSDTFEKRNAFDQSWGMKALAILKSLVSQEKRNGVDAGTKETG